jgi:hypothetical protein
MGSPQAQALPGSREPLLLYFYSAQGVLPTQDAAQLPPFYARDLQAAAMHTAHRTPAPTGWSPPRSMRTTAQNATMVHIIGVPLIILASIGVGFMTVRAPPRAHRGERACGKPP